MTKDNSSVAKCHSFHTDSYTVLHYLVLFASDSNMLDVFFCVFADLYSPCYDLKKISLVYVHLWVV